MGFSMMEALADFHSGQRPVVQMVCESLGIYTEKAV